MKLYDLITPIIIGIVIVSAVIGFFSIKFMGEDNVIEEVAEEVIKSETGVNLDLSPGTPEPG